MPFKHSIMHRLANKQATVLIIHLRPLMRLKFALKNRFLSALKTPKMALKIFANLKLLKELRLIMNVEFSL